MPKTLGMRWLVVSLSATMLLLFASACTTTETVVVPGETVVVEKVVKELVTVPGEIVVVEKIVKEEVQVPGETVVVEKEVIKTVEVVKAVPVEVIKEVRQGYVTDPTTGKAVSAPQYGGTLTSAHDELPPHCDSYSKVGYANLISSAVIERAALMDWAVDREEWHLGSTYKPPSYFVPHLAESWEITDPLTVVLNVRNGVQWQDKAPMNGRDLTADDFVYNYHRVTGTGSGFTDPGQYAGFLGYQHIESMEATDKHTVVFKLNEDTTGKNFYGGLNIAEVIAWGYHSDIYPPEVIQEHGNGQDCNTLIGTGPLMLREYVHESVVTWEKNPNYWGNDPKYPENRLPYVDELVGLYMPESATQVAALRSAKVDFGTKIKSIDQVESLARTNPEIELASLWYRSDNSFAFSLHKEPFDDLRVRQAMNMALDHETINLTFYRGYGNPVPSGLLSDDMTGYTVPFEEWPEELQKTWTYNPEAAEALLDEAGLPRGDDGIRFKTVLNHLAHRGTDYPELVTNYWREIGIEVEIRAVDEPTSLAMKKSLDFEGFWSWHMGRRIDPMSDYEMLYSKTGIWDWMGADDPVYDALWEASIATDDIEEKKRLAREMNLRMQERHLMVWGTESPQFIPTWPWIKGYNGELGLGTSQPNWQYVYLWIDQDMKKAMGY